ncbi:MAG: hypothetical protein HY748_17665 [Elusimicrobia bacterium]|nr:hypothetical protein [Elusimicrobiota bacterium]
MRTIGADLGGTWLRLCLADTDQGSFLLHREPAVPFEGIAAAFKRLNSRPSLRQGARGPRPDRLVLGSTGIWSAGRRRAATAALQGKACRVLVLSDIELARVAAFAGGPGILVVGGTGSVAYGRDGQGSARRAGGLGCLLGDEGSGFWIGREALRDPRLRRRLPGPDPLELVHAPRPARAIAALAPTVLGLAGRDPGFARIRRDACRALADLALEVRRELAFDGPAPVSWHGGLFRDRGFLEAFLLSLEKSGGFDPRPALLRAEVAAAVLPLRVLKA